VASGDENDMVTISEGQPTKSMTETLSLNSPPLDPRISATNPTRQSLLKVRGFSLNVQEARQLNNDVMEQNVLEEITQPRDERRNIALSTPTFSTEIQPLNSLK